MIRSTFVSLASSLGIVLLVACSAYAQKINVWIGTGSSPLSQGIYHSTFDTKEGKLTPSRLVAEMDGPGFLAKHPKHPVLYAVGGINKEQVVAAFTMKGEGANASLSLINALPIGDGGAAHVSVDKTGKTLLTAQYGGGSLAVFSLRDDGGLQSRTQLIDHEGPSKVNPARQEASHAHWTGVSPDNRFAFVPDLGLDAVVIYQLDAVKSEVKPHGKGIVPPGSGPRHMKFHNNGKWIYVLNELTLTITVFDYDAQAGTMTPKQTIATVPQQELAREKAKSCSEIRVHPSGKYVYAANRGHDTITAFAINAQDGTLKEIQRENVRGATPRNFNLTPDGQWLLAGGQLSNTLGVFSVDPNQGTMVFHQQSIFVPTPICVLFDQGD
ncbi:MAG: lactonase family protein [Pirellulales bacterium]